MDDEDAVLIAAHFAESEGVQFQWYWRLGEKMEFAREMIEENEGADALMAFACQTETILR